MSQYAVYSDEKVDSKIPEGPVAEKWTNFKAHQKLVNLSLIQLSEPTRLLSI